MKPANIFQYLLIAFFLAGSCTGQTTKTKCGSTNQPQTNKTRHLEHLKLAPFEKEGQKYMPGQVLVKFRDGTDEGAIETIRRQLALETIRVSPKLRLYRMKILDGSSVEEVIERLQGFDEVEYSEPNYIVEFQ
jgi:hypothetical protein